MGNDKGKGIVCVAQVKVLDDGFAIVKQRIRKKRGENDRAETYRRYQFMSKKGPIDCYDCDANAFAKHRFWSRVRGFFRAEVAKTVREASTIKEEARIKPAHFQGGVDLTLDRAARSACVHVTGDGRIFFRPQYQIAS